MSDSFEPFVLKNSIGSWPASEWTPSTLSERFGDRKFRVRLGLIDCVPGAITWETSSSYVEATLHDFFQWVAEGNVNEVKGELRQFDRHQYWGYIDYKYMFEYFDADELKMVDWSVFGLDNDGLQSTFWIGSTDAHTPCHYDSYGFNLHAQIYGSKRWVLFPPADGRLMKPTRLPYEESSIFSSVDVRHPPSTLENASPRAVLLHPGDVLCIPPRWWHFVQCADTSISINSWIDVESDLGYKVIEASTRLLVALLSEHITDKLIDKTVHLDKELELFNDVMTFGKRLQRDKTAHSSKDKLLHKFWQEHASRNLPVPKVSYGQLCEFLGYEPTEEAEAKTSSQLYSKEDVISALLQPAVVDAVCAQLLNGNE